MYRIDSSTAAAALPTPAAAGTEGYFTEGNPSTSTPATVVGQDWLNMVQEELVAVVAAAGIARDKTNNAQVIAAIQSIAKATGPGGYAVRGLVAANNPGTPATKFDAAADLVVLRNPSDGTVKIVSNTGTITNDITLANTVSNGRDQAAAFSNGSWIHFYFIWNGTSLVTRSSLNAPPTGPTLQTGETHWAYIGAVYTTGSFANVHIRGQRVYYDSQQIVVNNGSATSPTAINLSSVIPPNAAAFTVSTQYLRGISDSAGTIDIFLNMGHTSSSNTDIKSLGGVGVTNTASQTFGGPTGDVELPNVGQQYYYYMNMTSGSTPQVLQAIASYTVPNGGE